jgi:hypothetical protein
MVACHRSPNNGRLSIVSGFESCSVTEPQSLCSSLRSGLSRRNSIRRDQLHPAATRFRVPPKHVDQDDIQLALALALGLPLGGAQWGQM